MKGCSFACSLGAEKQQMGMVLLREITYGDVSGLI
jgi:hypothetical protein